MKICTIVGVRKSGKTTTITGLIQELKARGYRVGTVKSVFCPEFTLDTKGSNTSRHKEAGADLVCVKGKKETDIMLPANESGDFYKNLPVDFLLLEGEYEFCVPRIICARRETEADERMTEDTIALAGRIADRIQEYGNLRVYHSIKEGKALADLVESLPNATFPIARRPMMTKAAAFCQCGCHKAQKKQQEKERAILEAHPADTKRKHIFLTGEKGVGKSTLVRRLTDVLKQELVGYLTLPYEIEGIHKGYYMHSLVPMGQYENDSPVMIRAGEQKMISVAQTFETLGVAVMELAKKEKTKIAVMDELGKAEKHAPAFQKAVFSCLDTQRLVIGVLQKGAGDFTDAVAMRQDVEVYEVTKENRDVVFDFLCSLMNC